MPWFRLEDSFHSNLKVQRAGNGAVGLWVRCGTWSSHYLTDGVIPPEVYTSMGRTREVEALVAQRLWVPTSEGMLMPDYLDYQPSKAEVDQRRKKDMERKRAQREAVDHDPVSGRFTSRRTDPFR